MRVPRVLREHRARPLHGPPLQPPRHPVGRRLGRQPAGRARGRPAGPGRRRRAGRVLRRPVQRGRRRARRRHRADAAPDREPDAVPPAARPWPAQGQRARRSARCSTSSAPTARSSASTAATGRCSAAPAETSSGRCSMQFPFLPAGCHMQLDEKAAEIVLRSLREAIPSRWPAKVDELRSLRRERPDIGLAEFLRRDRPRPRRRLRRHARAGPTCSRRPARRSLASGPERDGAAPSRRPAPARRRRTSASTPTGALLAGATAPSSTALPERERRLVHMLVAVARRPGAAPRTHRVQDAVDLLWAHPQVRAELARAARRARRPDRPPPPAARHPSRRAAADPRPLQPHRDPRRLRPAATGAKIAAWQSGVYEAKAANAELFAFTLDKSSGGFSPTTRYRDYAISRTLIHWESQSITRADSPTGLRYRNHERDGRTILLFTRLRADDRAFWFLGPATLPRPRRREARWPSPGSSTHPLPGDLYAVVRRRGRLMVCSSGSPRREARFRSGVVYEAVSSRWPM